MADKHRSSIEYFNREQASRNSDRGMSMRPGEGGGSGPTTSNTGGSMKVNDPGPKGKGAGMGGSSDAKALGKASAGKIETMRGTNVS